MAIAFVAKGTWGAGTTSFSPGIPAGMQAGDLMILDVHTANRAVTTPSGWTEVTGSPLSTGTQDAAGGTRLTQYYRWWQSGDSAPTVSVTSGTVANGIISGYRGVDTTTPFDATPTSNIISTASTTLTFASITTATAGAMLHLAAARDQDLNNSAAVDTWTNANLTGLTEIHDQVVNTSVGGGIANAYGTKTTAGSTGSTTANQTNSIACCMTIALRPLLVTHATTGTLVGNGGAVSGTAQHNIPHATSGALTGAGVAVEGAASRADGGGGGAPLEIKQATYTIDDSGTTSTTVSATLTGVTAGSCLVAAVGFNMGGDVTSVSDGTAYTESASGVCADTDMAMASRVFYLANAGSGSHTVTATFNGSIGYRRLVFLEVGGVTATSPADGAADQAQAAAGLGTDVISSTATGTTTQADAIVLGFTHCTSQAHPADDNVTAGTGYTLISATPTTLRAEYKIVSATGTQTATFSQATTNRRRTTHVLVLKKAAGGAATHATTGGLTGQGASVSGSAAHVAVHADTGALAGSGTAVSGSANRFRAHASSGDLAGSGAAVSGVASHSAGAVTHATTGALAASGAATAGAASRFRTFSTSGVLAGQGVNVTGAANRFRAHPTTGTLTGQGSAVSGAAARTRQHDTAGVLLASGAALAGSAQHNVPHATSGTLAAAGAAVAGAAGRNTTAVTHVTTGALAGPVSAVAGIASRWRAFATSGQLAGPGAAVTGAAARTRLHATTGTLAGSGAETAGAALHNIPHGSSGTLTAAGASVAGAGGRNTTAVSHATSGTLAGQGPALTGVAGRWRAFAAAGTLTGPGAKVAGTALRFHAFATAGALTGAGAVVVASAGHNIKHATSGALAGTGALVTGIAARSGPASTHECSGALSGGGTSLAGISHRNLGGRVIAAPKRGVIVSASSRQLTATAKRRTTTIEAIP